MESTTALLGMAVLTLQISSEKSLLQTRNGAVLEARNRENTARLIQEINSSAVCLGKNHYDAPQFFKTSPQKSFHRCKRPFR